MMHKIFKTLFAAVIATMTFCVEAAVHPEIQYGREIPSANTQDWLFMLVLAVLLFVIPVVTIWRLGYYSFKGRARRMEYGLAAGSFIIWGIIFRSVLFQALEEGLFLTEENFHLFNLIAFLLHLVLLLPFAVRRIHDLGSSGWSVVWLFVPAIGNIAELYLMYSEGEKRSNEYGPDPNGSQDYFWTEGLTMPSRKFKSPLNRVADFKEDDFEVAELREEDFIDFDINEKAQEKE